jgi:2-polyprenyl-3-methyl-5-hydroxy-6-metoxy-1,4-benzoquinol methylase
MLSDLRVLAEPLDKWSCRTCAIARRGRRARGAAVFGSGYSLYDHAPGAPRETARQRAYAAWIAAHCPAPPVSIFDAGCGNGSLLLALGARWPAARLRGLDASPESVAHARSAGIDASPGLLEQAALQPADLVISVNVIEHTDNPSSFVAALASALAPGGTLVLVCPDGGRPWSELVVADHVWSLTPEHLSRFVEQAGLHLVGRSSAPSELGAFQMVVAGQGEGLSHATPVPASVDALIEARHAYLERWRGLDDLLQARAGAGPLTCFGAGEAAGLLRAYAPATWARVTACTTDAPEQPAFDNLPVVHYAGYSGPQRTMLLGVRPAAQPAVAQRLQADGLRVVRWDDVIAE